MTIYIYGKGSPTIGSLKTDATGDQVALIVSNRCGIEPERKRTLYQDSSSNPHRRKLALLTVNIREVE